MMHNTNIWIFLLLVGGPGFKIYDALAQGRPSPGADEPGQKVTKILDSILQGYDKRVRPNYEGAPVDVNVTMYILSIPSLSAANMEFSVDYYFRQSWIDERLKFIGPPAFITLGSESVNNFWEPDTFTVNEKISTIPSNVNSEAFVKIWENGTILISKRFLKTASCPMDLQYFPMDRQLCTLEFESFGYTMADIRYRWGKGMQSIGMSPDTSLPEFVVEGYRMNQFEIHLSSGQYSRLACELHFQRSIGYYILQMYLPATTILIISWVSFWLNKKAVTARTLVAITTVLTMGILVSSVNRDMPKISYLKAVDIYLGTCFFMVAATLIELIIVDYLTHRSETTSDQDYEGGLTNKVCNKLNITAENFEWCCRIGFPVFFFVFITIYWIRYSNIHSTEIDVLDF